MKEKTMTLLENFIFLIVSWFLKYKKIKIETERKDYIVRFRGRRKFSKLKRKTWQKFKKKGETFKGKI
ncbi:MAG: hypothetical protein Q4D90_09635 [bacterium]|nr:hypothetical protein [bacterium]